MDRTVNNDITVKCGSGYVNIRVGAIIINDGKVLMAGNEGSDYMYSVGGRVKFGETAEQAVIREVLEETGVQMEIDRLGFVHENFFYGDYQSECNQKLVYEISFFFYMKAPKNFNPPNSNSLSVGGFKEFLKWVELDSEQVLYPEFFRTELKAPSNSVKHIVTVQR